MYVYGAHLCGLLLDPQACSAASQMQLPSCRCSHDPKINAHLPLFTHITKTGVLSLQMNNSVVFTKVHYSEVYLWEWSERFPKHLHRSDPCSSRHYKSASQKNQLGIAQSPALLLLSSSLKPELLLRLGQLTIQVLCVRAGSSFSISGHSFLGARPVIIPRRRSSPSPTDQQTRWPPVKDRKEVIGSFSTASLSHRP